MPTNNQKDNHFVFRKNDDIGAAGAEDDELFLSECFVDTGELESLLDCEDAKRIVVGRTGAGKTALLSHIENSSRITIPLSPHSLSLNYIANNTVIQFFEEAGVNLSPFYSLLWRHIFVVELLKAKYNIRTEDSQKVCIARLRDFLSKDHIKEQAIDYLEKWGNEFWLTTEERMHELTERIASSLSASLTGELSKLNLSANAARELSSEVKKEIVERGKQAVSKVQIRELENLISVLDEAVFTDRLQPYYMTIDTLDEEWADDRIRFRLIKALIDSVRRFRKVNNVKIIMALRQDLLDKVLHSINDPGFQEEKYESLYLYVNWNRNQLKELITRRLNFLIQRKYTNSKVTPEEIFPNSVVGRDALDYILDRTFLRPRDAILFVNECISLSEGKTSFTAAILKKAEEEYSHKRLQSLATEWQIIYPNLKPITEILYGSKEHFPVSEITTDFLSKKYEEAIEQIPDTTIDPITISLDKLYTDSGNFNSIRNQFVRALHFVGLIGIKSGPTSSINWVHQSRLSLAPGQIRPSSTIYIHPMFHRALGIRT